MCRLAFTSDTNRFVRQSSWGGIQVGALATIVFMLEIIHWLSAVVPLSASIIFSRKGANVSASHQQPVASSLYPVLSLCVGLAPILLIWPLALNGIRSVRPWSARIYLIKGVMSTIIAGGFVLYGLLFRQSPRGVRPFEKLALFWTMSLPLFLATSAVMFVFCHFADTYEDSILRCRLQRMRRRRERRRGRPPPRAKTSVSDNP